jgi:hypothetical protein
LLLAICCGLVQTLQMLNAVYLGRFCNAILYF